MFQNKRIVSESKCLVGKNPRFLLETSTDGRKIENQVFTTKERNYHRAGNPLQLIGTSTPTIKKKRILKW